MSPAVTTVLTALEGGGLAPRQNGAGWQSRCPAHEDRVASLSIGEGRDGRALLKCHAGCQVAAVCEAVGLTLADLMPPRAPRGAAPEQVYAYRDKHGAVLFRVVRRPGKRFHQQRPDDRGGWVNNVKGVRRVPYRLPEVLVAIAKGETIYIVEGEKDADTLAALGLAATCNAGGAGKWRADYAVLLAGAMAVRVLADNDEPGRMHAQAVATSFHAASVTDLKVVHFADLPEHGDVSDWLKLPAQAALTPEVRRAALVARVEAAAPWTPVPATSPAAPKPEPRRQGRALVFADPEPWPDPVDGAALLDEVATLVRGYVVMPEPAVHAAALWVSMTYLLDHMPVAPRLIVTSPTRECGKSRLLAVLAALARRSLSASSVTPAALFRLIERHAPTLFLDEMDNARLNENDELRALLNSGHTRGTAYAIRTVGEDHEPRTFSTWCPIALASIGELPDPLTSRSVVIQLQRKRRGEAVTRLREARLHDELAPLRRRLARWAADHGAGIGARDPDLPAVLDGRRADNAGALVSIADEAGGRWPDRARRALVALAGAVDEDSAGVIALTDLRDLFAERRVDKLASEDVVVALVALDSRPWAEWAWGKPLTKHALARLLRPFDVQSRTLRLGDRFAKGYALPDLEDAFARYLPLGNVTASQAATGAAQTSFFDSSRPSPRDGCENATSPSIDAPCDVVTVENPSGGGQGTSGRAVDGTTPGGDLGAMLDRHGWGPAEVDP